MPASRVQRGLAPPSAPEGTPRAHKRMRHRAAGNCTTQGSNTRATQCTRASRGAPTTTGVEGAATPPKHGRSASRPKISRPAQPQHRHFHEKTRPTQPLHWHFRKKFRPAGHQTPFLGCFERAGRTFSRSRPPSDHAGRTFSRTRRDNVATLKPTTPLLTPEQQPLKPPSPLHPKTPNSHPQWR